MRKITAELWGNTGPVLKTGSSCKAPITATQLMLWMEREESKDSNRRLSCFSASHCSESQSCGTAVVHYSFSLRSLISRRLRQVVTGPHNEVDCHEVVYPILPTVVDPLPALLLSPR